MSENILEMRDAQQLIADLPDLLAQSIYNTQSTDNYAEIGAQIVNLSGLGDKRLWVLKYPKKSDGRVAYHYSTYTKYNFGAFAEKYARARLKNSQDELKNAFAMLSDTLTAEYNIKHAYNPMNNAPAVNPETAESASEIEVHQGCKNFQYTTNDLQSAINQHQLAMDKQTPLEQYLTKNVQYQKPDIPDIVLPNISELNHANQNPSKYLNSRGITKIREIGNALSLPATERRQLLEKDNTTLIIYPTLKGKINYFISAICTICKSNKFLDECPQLPDATHEIDALDHNILVQIATAIQKFPLMKWDDFMKRKHWNNDKNTINGKILHTTQDIIDAVNSDRNATDTPSNRDKPDKPNSNDAAAAKTNADEPPPPFNSTYTAQPNTNDNPPPPPFDATFPNAPATSKSPPKPLSFTQDGQPLPPEITKEYKHNIIVAAFKKAIQLITTLHTARHTNHGCTPEELLTATGFKGDTILTYYQGYPDLDANHEWDGKTLSTRFDLKTYTTKHMRVFRTTIFDLFTSYLTRENYNANELAKWMITLCSVGYRVIFTEGGLGGEGEEGKLLALTARLIRDDNDNQIFDDIGRTLTTPTTHEMLEKSKHELKRMKGKADFETQMTSDRFYYDKYYTTRQISFGDAQKIFTDVWDGNGEAYEKEQLNDALMFAISAINDTDNLILPNNTQDATIKNAYNELFAEIFTAVKDLENDASTTNALVNKLKAYGQKTNKPLDPKKDLLRIKKLIRTPIKYINKTESKDLDKIDLKNARSELHEIFDDNTIKIQYRPLAALCKILKDNPGKKDSENILKKYYIHELHKFGRKHTEAKTMCETIDLILSNRWGLKRKRDTVKSFFKRGK